MQRLGPIWRDLRRATGRHRRVLAAGLGAAAVASGLNALAPPAAHTVAVVAAAHDLAGGARITESDVRAAEFLPATVPSGALRAADDAVGRVLAAPLRAGAPLTDLSLLGDRLISGYGRGLVGAPVRIGDAAAVSLLRVGDTVDVLASSANGTTTASVVAADAPVIAIPAADGDSSSFDSGALLVLAVSPQVATGLAEAAVSDRLSVVLTG